MKRILSFFAAMSFLVCVKPLPGAAYGSTPISDIDWSHFSYGNANADCEVNVLDLVRIKKYLAGLPVALSITASDLNGDGKIDALDLAAVRELLLGG